MIALRLNAPEYVVEVLEQIQQEEIHFIVGALPIHHVTALLAFLVDLVCKQPYTL